MNQRSRPTGAANAAAGGDLGHLIDSNLEQSILGAILEFGDSAYGLVETSLTTNDFGVDKHRWIYAAVQKVAPEIPIGVNAVYGALMEMGKLDVVEGLTGLLDIAGRGLPSLVGFELPVKRLREKTAARKAWRIAEIVSKSIEIHGFNGNAPEVAAAAQDLITLCAGIQSQGGVDYLPPVADTSEPIKYVREPEVPCGAIVGLTGDSGSGKSTLATAWIRDANTLGIPCLLLDRESPRSIATDRMNRLGLIDSPLLRWWGGWTGDVPGPGSPSIRNWVVSCDPKPLIVIDSLIAFLESDENSASDVRAFMNRLRKLADLGAAVIIVHHDGKSDSARDFRGSSDFKAAVDQAYHVTNISSDSRLDRLSLRCFKSRFGFSGTLVYLYANGRLIRDERPDAVIRTVGEQLTELLRTQPGIKTKAFEDLAAGKGLGRNKARDFLTNGVLAGTIQREDAGKNQFRHYLPEVQK